MNSWSVYSLSAAEEGTTELTEAAEAAGVAASGMAETDGVDGVTVVVPLATLKAAIFSAACSATTMMIA